MNRLVFILCLVSTVALAAPGTYYIDYNASDDSANGTAKATPWKRCPGMQGFAGTYSHVAGDHFIFKGGVTWPNSCFQLTISAGGSSSSVVDHYGYDSSWYNGGSWTRPKFDFGGAVNTTQRIYSTQGYILFEGFELVGNTNSSGGNYGPSSTVFLSASTSTIQYCYVHKWEFNSGPNDNAFILFGGNIVSNIVDGTESLHGSQGSGSVSGSGLVAYNSVSNTIEGLHLGNADCFSNTVAYIVETWDGTTHGNAIYSFQGGHFHENIIHDVWGGYQMMYCEMSGNKTNWVYNNVIWNPGSALVKMECDNCALYPTQTNGTLYVYNNTLVGGASYNCIGYSTGEAYPYFCVVATNNHFIADVGPIQALTEVYSSYIGKNLTNTVSAAATAGYTSANRFAPTSGSSPTVDQGVSLASQFTNDFLNVSRPQNSVWDIGAYEYTSGGSVAPSISTQPTSQTNMVGATCTFTVTASGTPTPNYTWYRNGSQVGADSSSYTTPALQLAWDGQAVYCALTNSAGYVISDTVSLGVTNAPPSLPSHIDRLIPQTIKWR